MQILTFAMILRRMSALPKVLMLCHRLGGTVTYVSAAEGRANMALTAPRDRTHRFAPQLRRIVDVMELTELHAADADLMGDSSVGGDLRRTA